MDYRAHDRRQAFAVSGKRHRTAAPPPMAAPPTTTLPVTDCILNGVNIDSGPVHRQCPGMFSRITTQCTQSGKKGHKIARVEPFARLDPRNQCGLRCTSCNQGGLRCATHRTRPGRSGPCGGLS
nr:hypothetical protein [Kibdelosporangium sp. MJ126-NF4]CTQ89180.1 hypothetical protein [Kibdelosporangium sp. MJ126-NF4]